ncbi:hypothetical protein [Polaribacter porphyrae]|uniref:Uncharacterized protein n=1 Tax=Polaribacter porphyrae TaxID=1137780 RepID=A0A2S7WS50_9FLAO|nr:hypothetical protein [Polaribacter porphyrae]PQJ80296.1 hypothetical protein BTO18_14410 [Polaribacter porphyrae]
MKKIITIILSLFIAIIFIVNIRKYYLTKDLIKDIELNTVSLNLFIRGDLVNHFDEFPKEKKDIINIFHRYKIYSGNSSSFLDYGYNIKYDSVNDISYVYSLGIDKIDNNLYNIPYNTIDSIGLYTGSLELNIRNFLKSKKSDIIFFVFKNNNLFNIPKIKDLNDIVNLKLVSEINGVYKASLGLNFIPKKKKENFISDIKKIEKKINRRNFLEEDYIKGRTKTIFFRYKDKNLSIISNNNLSNKFVEKYYNEIERHFSNIDKSYFDYAVFPITFVEEILP